jgi:hypothetical protein
MHLKSLSTWHQQLGIARVPYPSLFLILPFGRNDKVDEIASYKVKVIIGPFPDCGLDTGIYTMSLIRKGLRKPHVVMPHLERSRLLSSMLDGTVGLLGTWVLGTTMGQLGMEGMRRISVYIAR